MSVVWPFSVKGLVMLLYLKGNLVVFGLLRVFFATLSSFRENPEELGLETHVAT